MSPGTFISGIVERDVRTGNNLRTVGARAWHTGKGKAVTICGLLDTDPSQVAYKDMRSGTVYTAHHSWFRPLPAPAGE
jgi:hypothetical protein